MSGLPSSESPDPSQANGPNVSCLKGLEQQVLDFLTRQPERWAEQARTEHEGRRERSWPTVLQERVTSFEDLSLAPSLATLIGELGYVLPTPIQRKSIPLMLAGKDLIAKAKTGSGKTAAFALPILDRLQREGLQTNAGAVLESLILCPTRELCAQVAREVRKLGCRHSGLVVSVLSGGEAVKHQTASLERGVHIVVGTPGRLLDHIERGSIDLSNVNMLVLDEADRMLDMGFLPAMESILKVLPTVRQTVLFSATMPETIREMSRVFQKNATWVEIKDEERAPIRELSIGVDHDKKIDALYWALGHYPNESALVFCNFKKTVAELDDALKDAGVDADCLHGDLEQFERDQVLARFRNQSMRVLIATDVAGRGIDVEGLDLVISFELSPQPEVYVHRIGRTGRAGRQGVAVTLVTRRDHHKIEEIEKLTGRRIEQVMRKKVERASLLQSARREARMATILISGGRKDKLRPGDVLGALCGDAGGLSGDDVGKIEMHDRLCYVAVSKECSGAAVRSLNTGRIKKKRYRASLVERKSPGQRREEKRAEPAAPKHARRNRWQEDDGPGGLARPEARRGPGERSRNKRSRDSRGRSKK